MGIEIERKFLVTGDQWRKLATDAVFIRQGYLSLDPDRAVRIRIQGDTAQLTIKGRISQITRHEFEYAIPVSDAEQMLVHLCPHSPILKKRYRVPEGNHTWEIDCFEGENHGLIIAEVELSHPDEAVHLPDWVGTEVTLDPRYLNVHLARHPWKQWKPDIPDGKGV